MKKLLFVVCMMSFVFSAVPVGAIGVAEKVDVKIKQKALESTLEQMNTAAEKNNFKKVVDFANKAIAQAKELKQQASPDGITAIVDGEPTPKYILFEASVAPEFLVLAQIMQGKMTLSQAIEKNPALVKEKQGFLAWIAGKERYINVRYMSIAESFRKWKGCPEQVDQAQKQGLIQRPVQAVCNK